MFAALGAFLASTYALNSNYAILAGLFTMQFFGVMI
jgi:hypothetical protein